MVRFPLIHSKHDFGTLRWGFIPRLPSDDPILECLRYEAFLSSRGIESRCTGGYVWIETEKSGSLCNVKV